MFSESIPSISVQDFAQRLESKDDLQLFDVREYQEVAIASINGFEILPLSEFRKWQDKVKTDFDPNKETYVICHHGVRSAQMCVWLLEQGYTNVKNITGGIDAYSSLVDTSIPHY